MKRSNLFLTATTGLLAIASFAFAKTHKFNGTIVTGYCKTANGACPTITTPAKKFNVFVAD